MIQNLLIIAGNNGRYHYMTKYCGIRYRTTLFHYIEQENGKKRAVIKGRINAASGIGRSTEEICVRIFFKRFLDKKVSTRRILYPIFYTFLQPFYAVFRAYGYLSKYEVCIAAGLWAGIIGLTLRNIGKTRFLVYEDLDIFPYFWKNKLFRIILYSIEKYVVRQADLVVSVGNPLAELRKIQGAKDVIIIPNGVDYDRFRKGQQKRDHIPTLIYVGGLEEYQGIDLPIRSLPQITVALPHIRYLILGDGPFKTKLNSLIEKLGLEEAVSLLGRQEHERLPVFFSESDIGIATSKRCVLTEYSVPYKILEYMAAGLPVITTRKGDKAGIADESQGVIPIEPNEEEFSRIVLDIFSNTEKYKRLSGNAIEVAMNYDWSKLFEIEFRKIERAVLRKEVK